MSSRCPHCQIPNHADRPALHRTLEELGEAIGGDATGCRFGTPRSPSVTRLLPGPAGASPVFRQNLLQVPASVLKEAGITRVQLEEAVVLLEERVPPGIPLEAWRMKVPQASVELLWSWFRILVRLLSQLHRFGVWHGAINAETVWIQQYDEQGRVLNTCTLGGLFGGVRAQEAPAQGIARDIQDLGTLILSNFEPQGRAAGELLFRELLERMSSGGPSLAMEAIWEEISPYERLSQWEPSEDRRLEVKSKRWYQSQRLWLVPVLFLLSLLIARVFSTSGEEPAPPPVGPPLQMRAPLPAPVTVDLYQGPFDPTFALHRVTVQSDALLALQPDALHRLHLDPALRKLRHLGLSIPTVCSPLRSGCLVGFDLKGDRWRPVLRYWGEQVCRDERNMAPPRSSQKNTPPPCLHKEWKTRYQKQFTLHRRLDHPPVLAGVFGRLLDAVEYLPDRPSSTLLLLVWRFPSQMAPRTSLWNALLGGIVPTHVVVRLGQQRGTLRGYAAASFARESDVSGARQHFTSFLRPLAMWKSVQISEQRKLLLVEFPLPGGWRN